ncbi:MAG: hypothetical protein WAV09_03135 [Minisyncoccia bacterium]
MSYSFGDALRAARLRFHWSDKWECFIRATVIDEERIQLDFAAPGHIPSRMATPRGNALARVYVLWWESPGCVRAMDDISSPTLRAGIRKAVSIQVDNTGREIAAPTRPTLVKEKE